MGPQLFIFDLDGTLIDSREDLATAVNLTRARYGLAPLSVEAVTRLVGQGMRALVASILEGRAADLEEAVRLQRAHYARHLCDRTRLYPGVADGLRALRAAGHRLALATNKPASFSLAILAHFGLNGVFESVRGGDSGPHLKPHPAMLLEILRELGVRAAEAWMVGDHATDLEAARRAGIRSVFLSGGMGEAGGEKPTRTYASFRAFVADMLGR